MPRWFHRRRRVDLGRYVAPERVPEAPVSELVDEGVLIAGAAVRLAVTNLMIIRSVRDRLDYDEARYAAAVREELENLALEKIADAERIARVRETALTRSGLPEHHSDYRSVDIHALERREAVSRALAERLRELSRDESWADEIVSAARGDALSAVAASLIAGPLSSPAGDPDYEQRRPERLRALADDLLLLQITPPEDR